jgi:hypothetical protein
MPGEVKQDPGGASAGLLHFPPRSHRLRETHVGAPMIRHLLHLLLTTSLTLPGLALAGELSPEQLASIRRDEQAALDRVNTAHGDKKSSEMDNAERRRLIEDQRQAVREVMEKHGVSEKDYARQVARMGPKGNARVEEALRALEEKEREKAAREQKKAEDAPDISIQQGFSDKDPVEVDAVEGAPPVVEQDPSVDEQDPPVDEQ